MVSFGVCYGIADGVRVQFDADDFSGIAGCDEADGSDSAVGVHDAFVSGEAGQGDGFFVQIFRLNRVDLVEGLRGDAEGAAAEFILDVTASEEDNVAFSEYHAVGAVVDVQYDRGDLRMEYTPGNCYNFHPGSHTGQGAEEGIRLISEMLNEILKPEQTTTVLLETMAGKGTEVGRSFEELAAILERVELKDHMGVCLDTCHVYDAGYDIVHQLDDVIEEFDRVVGLSKLKAIHLNDSKNPFESHKDRHEKIGEGSLGLAAFERIVTHPALTGLPFYLETPNELDGYAREIALLRGYAK